MDLRLADVYATYGEPTQHLVWFHLEDHPAVLIGKRPLFGSPPLTVEIRVTNIGRPPSGPIVVTDAVPAGLSASAFSVAPNGIAMPPTGEQTLTWDLPSLDGSMLGGLHPSAAITYSLTGSVSDRTVVPPTGTARPAVRPTSCWSRRARPQEDHHSTGAQTSALASGVIGALLLGYGRDRCERCPPVVA